MVKLKTSSTSTMHIYIRCYKLLDSVGSDFIDQVCLTSDP